MIRIGGEHESINILPPKYVDKVADPNLSKPEIY